MASFLRSISFAAVNPSVGDASELSAAFAMVAKSLAAGLRGAEFSRLAERAPDLAKLLKASVLASCGALLGARSSDSAFQWAIEELEQLSLRVPQAEAIFPGTYYHQIFAADVNQLGVALATSRREIARRTALANDVLDVIARPGAAVAEILSVGRAAGEANLPREASAAAAVAAIAERESTLRVRSEETAAEIRELKRAVKEAAAQAEREAAKLSEAERKRVSTERELEQLKGRLRLEEETRRKVEAASMSTLQEMRKLEEDRRAATEADVQRTGFPA